MEQTLDITEILKNKPIGIKLYSSTFGYIKFNGVHKDKVYFYSKDANVHSVKSNGKMYDDGECIIFPSKMMHDWSKFAWKKGDVLTNSSGFKIFFDKWVNDNYTKFLGKIKLLGDSHCYDAAFYNLVPEEKALEFIKSVEEINNGKLNRKTLEIEKFEFKDGDIIVTDAVPSMLYSKCIFILKGDWNIYKNRANSYIFYNVSNNHICFNIVDKAIRDRDIRFATEEERQQLFDALAKEGKAWDAEKKQIVDLKPKVELKPFDKVLVRNDKEDQWSANIFSYQVRDIYYCLGESYWRYCIPYIGNEHLLGTTKDVEG